MDKHGESSMKWREDREKRKAYGRDYYKKNKSKLQKSSKGDYQKNRDKLLAKNKKNYQDNKEKIIKKQIIYSKKPEVVEKRKIRLKKYRKDNREKISKYYKKYRQKKSYKDKNRELNKKDRIKHKKHYDARKLAQLIPIQKNKLCEVCNQRLTKERHHKDYNKPLEIMFVCIVCHKRLHCKD